MRKFQILFLQVYNLNYSNWCYKKKEFMNVKINVFKKVEMEL
jgi:hypothetical protein